jgi:hypothetical protein
MKGQTMTETYKYVADNNWPDIIKLVHVTDTPTEDATTPDDDTTETDNTVARRIFDLTENVDMTRTDTNAAIFRLSSAVGNLGDILGRSGQRKAVEAKRRYLQRIGASPIVDTTLLAGKLGARKMGDRDRPGLLLGIELEDGTVVHTDSYRAFTAAAIGAHCKWKVPPARGAAFVADDVIPPALLGAFAHVCDRHGDGWGAIRTMDADQLYTLATLAQDMGTVGELEKASAMKLADFLRMLRDAVMTTPPAVATFMVGPTDYTVVTFDHTEPHADDERVVFVRHDGQVVTVAGRILASLRGDLVWTQATDTALGPIQGRTEDGTIVAVVMPIRDGGSSIITDDMLCDAAVHLADDCDTLPATARRNLDPAALVAAVGAVRASVVVARQAIGANLEAVRELERVQRAG